MEDLKEWQLKIIEMTKDNNDKLINKMKTVNSLSGGKTSSYIAANYPADYNVFALVRTDDKNCLFPDAKVRQMVSDRLGTEFIGTLEDDLIVYTMLDLEQFIGQKIHWVTGKTFDEVVLRGKRDNGDKVVYIPNPTMRFCTTEMKLQPIFEWWLKEIKYPAEFRIGFRANEIKRANTMIDKTNENGLCEFHHIIGKTKTGSRNKWGYIEWQKPAFPLIKDAIFKDNIEEFWKDKPVRFAVHNNCIGCFHREIHFLKYMSNKHPNKFQWFVDREKESRKVYNDRSWNLKVSYEKIKQYHLQLDLFDEDFNDCDSGYCGL